jgi:hypothetical protein
MKLQPYQKEMMKMINDLDNKKIIMKPRRIGKTINILKAIADDNESAIYIFPNKKLAKEFSKRIEPILK